MEDFAGVLSVVCFFLHYNSLRRIIAGRVHFLGWFDEKKTYKLECVLFEGKWRKIVGSFYA